MMKRLLALLLALGIVAGGYTVSLAEEPVLKLRLYAPTYMLSYLDSVLSYGIGLRAADGTEKVVTLPEKSSTDGIPYKYQNNIILPVKAEEVAGNTITYAFVTVSVKMGNGENENRTYYYNSDGTSSFFKEAIAWEKDEDKEIMVYLSSLYVVTIRNDATVNDYYLKPAGDDERGRQVYFNANNKNVKLINKDNHVYIPIRCLAELFKFKVDYSNEGEYTRVDITSSDGKTSISLKTGQSAFVKYGGTEPFIDGMAPFISEGRTYVPARFLESLGMGVEYSLANKMIYIKPRTNEILD